MENTETKPIEKKEIGENYYLNTNCWLVKNLKYTPYKRCKYCEFKFQECLFLKFQIISFALIVLSFSLFFILEKRLSVLAIATVFSFVIVYGYFFNESTEKIIKSNFSLKKAKIILKGLTDNLASKVKEQTKDISEKNSNLEQQAHQLEKDKRELVELDRMKDEFLQMATHELNTPITVIKGKLDMALREDYCHLNKEQKDYFTPVLTDTDRLARLSKDILNVARIDQHRLAVNRSETDLDQLITSIVDGLQIKAKDKEIHLEYAKSEKDLPKITIDQGKISEVITNLVNNAIKFTDKGGVTVTTKDEGENVTVSIKDTGVGIDTNDQKHLFGKFYQVGRFDPNNPQEQQGTGLGLYISKNIIELHGGKIGLESEKDKGSTFYFSLPKEYKGSKAENGKLHCDEDAVRVL